MKELPAFENYSRAEVEQYLEGRRIGQKAQGPILDLWDTDRNAAVELLRKADHVVEVALASQAYADAWNYFLTNSLYLSDDVAELARPVFATLFAILGAAKLPDGMPSGKDLTQLQQDSSDQIWRLRASLQRALGLAPEPPSSSELA